MPASLLFCRKEQAKAIYFKKALVLELILGYSIECVAGMAELADAQD